MGKANKNIINFPSLLEDNNEIKFRRETMELYTIKQKKIQIKKDMMKGYKEMSQINIRLSEIGLAEDMRQLNIYETNLTGCEK